MNLIADKIFKKGGRHEKVLQRASIWWHNVSRFIDSEAVPTYLQYHLNNIAWFYSFFLLNNVLDFNNFRFFLEYIVHTWKRKRKG